MQDELRRSSIHDYFIASQSCITFVFAARQVIFVSPIPSVLNVFTPRPGALAQISAKHAMGLACATSCCTPSGAATRNQPQQRLRCRKLVHPVNGQHTCGVECPSMATGVRDIWLGFQGSPPDGGLIAGTHGGIPQGISTWGKLASSAGPCAEETVAQFINVQEDGLSK